LTCKDSITLREKKEEKRSEHEMNAVYQINTIHGSGTKEVTEVAAALVQETREVLSFLGDATLSIEAELKSLGEGDTASNLRFKGDKEKNNHVVSNYMKLFETYAPTEKPIIITTVPRKHRYITYSLTEGGEIEAHNSNTKGFMAKETTILKEFLESMNIDRTKVTSMREASSGAGYRTYLADLLAFIYLVDSHFHREMFEQRRKTPFVVNTQTLDEDGNAVLTEIDSGGRKWVPKEGYDYLYFTGEETPREMVEKKYENIFWEPKEGSIVKVYFQLGELLSKEENGMKKMVRDYMGLLGTYNRFSDYWVNDVDDALTIYMIYGAYKYATLTAEEEMVKDQLSKIIEGFS